MAKAIDVTGRRFGRLIVIRRAGHDAHGKALWICKCDCGAECARITAKFRRKHVSCGCWYNELRFSGVFRRTHGLANSRAYMAWRNMLARCEDPRTIGFERYAGRGITVCERWHDVRNFIADMGEPPPNLTLERINNNEGYSPDNCRWATRREQSHNTRQTRLLTVGNETYAMREWARRTQISRRTITERLARGWTPEEAVLTPAIKSVAGMPRARPRVTRHSPPRDPR